MKLGIIFFVAMVLSSFANAEVVTCTGITNDPVRSVQLPFELEIEGKTDRHIPDQKYYSSRIRYSLPDGSRLTQGIDLNWKVRTRPAKIIYSGLGAGNYLEFNFEADGSVKSSFLNNTLAGFKQLPVQCEIAGEIPSRPVCASAFNKNSALLNAILDSDLDGVEAALECGGDVNKADANGCTPLMYVLDSSCGRVESAQHISVFESKGTIIDLLINNGAFVNMADKFGETPLIKAAKLGIPDVYEAFLAAEADYDTQDKLGNTALMHAVYSGNESVVEDLLEGNPNRRVKNKKGQTAYDIAVQWRKDAIADLVRIPDLTVNILGKEDGACSPLLINVKQGQVVEIVLKATDKMFKIDAKKLGLSLMADRNGTAKQIFTASTRGQFGFTCGIHGAYKSSMGTIVVQ